MTSRARKLTFSCSFTRSEPVDLNQQQGIPLQMWSQIWNAGSIARQLIEVEKEVANKLNYHCLSTCYALSCEAVHKFFF